MTEISNISQKCCGEDTLKRHTSDDTTADLICPNCSTLYTIKVEYIPVTDSTT